MPAAAAAYCRRRPTHALLASLTRVASSGHCIAVAVTALLDFALEKLAKEKDGRKLNSRKMDMVKLPGFLSKPIRYSSKKPSYVHMAL